jgi:aminoglycoside 3-N-acetyltransferase
LPALGHARIQRMRQTSLSALRAHCDAVGVRAGQHLAVHSRLLSFGRIEGGAAAVFDTLRSMVGTNGTIAVPTYTLDLAEQDVFDPAASPPIAMGALAKHALDVPGVRRTASPMHSYAVIGAQADALLGSDHTTSFGDGSGFDVMEKSGFQQLLLGCTFDEGATFVHHVEASCGVPYRDWLTLPRRIRTSAGTRAVPYRYFGRRDPQCRNSFAIVESKLFESGRSCRVQIGSRWSSLTSLADIRTVVEDLLRADPYALVAQ